MENPDNKVWTKVYGVHEHELFFAKKLTAANNIVHIAISSGVENSGYPVAVEAANAFGNVKVIDSRHLSSGQGLMVLKACRMAQEGISAEEIAEAIKQDSAHVHTSFIVNDLEFLARAGQINERIANLTRAFMIRPVLKMKKGKLTIGGIYFGSKERAWKKYIEATMRNYPFMDKRIVFVTYVGLSSKDMELIRGWIEEIGRFEKIYFKKASPSIAVNCGVGTFGLLYRDFDT
jgi:DegV family protein with EDD domain